MKIRKRDVMDAMAKVDEEHMFYAALVIFVILVIMVISFKSCSGEAEFYLRKWKLDSENGLYAVSGGFFDIKILDLNGLELEDGQYGDGPKDSLKVKGGRATLVQPVKLTARNGYYQYGGIYKIDGVYLLVFWEGNSQMNWFFTLDRQWGGMRIGISRYGPYRQPDYKNFDKLVWISYIPDD